jgi:hypothetical protein
MMGQQSVLINLKHTIFWRDTLRERSTFSFRGKATQVCFQGPLKSVIHIFHYRDIEVKPPPEASRTEAS